MLQREGKNEKERRNTQEKWIRRQWVLKKLNLFNKEPSLIRQGALERDFVI